MTMRICCDGPENCSAVLPAGKTEREMQSSGWVHIPTVGSRTNVLRQERHLCPKCVRKMLEAMDG